MMRTSHIVALGALLLWCGVAVWIGADTFGVGECVAVVLIWAGLWVAFAILKVVNENRDGRTHWLAPVAIGIVAFALSLAHLPREAYVERAAGESDASFTTRAIREIARANA